MSLFRLAYWESNQFISNFMFVMDKRGRALFNDQVSRNEFGGMNWQIGKLKVSSYPPASHMAYKYSIRVSYDNIVIPSGDPILADFWKALVKFVEFSHEWIIETTKEQAKKSLSEAVENLNQFSY